MAPELAAKGGGFCVETEAEFVEALHRTEDPGLRARMGARGREVVLDYSVEDEVRRYLAVYERALAAHPGRERGRERDGIGLSVIAQLLV